MAAPSSAWLLDSRTERVPLGCPGYRSRVDIWQGHSRDRVRGTTDPSLAPEAGTLPWLSLVSQKTGAAPSPQPWTPGPTLASRLQDGAAPQGSAWPAPTQRGLQLARQGEDAACTARPLSLAPGSLLVVIGSICKDELEAVGLGQQKADVLVTPAGGGQVLEEEEQLLKISFF